MRVRALLGDDRSPESAGGDDSPALLHDRGTAGSGALLTGSRQRLAARIPLRLDPGRRAAAVVGIAALVVAIATGAWLVADRPQVVAMSTGSAGRAPATLPSTGASVPRPAVLSSSGATRSGSAAAAAPSSGSVAVVDVAGKVRHPGVYRLPTGSRVDDAIRAAGGALPGAALNSLNLAARVIDGQQIPVGITAAPAPVQVAGSAGSGDSAAPGSTADASGPVDLNTATAEQLQTLPGVGPVLSQHILDWRSAHGTFTSVQQLDDVPGIGTVKFGALHSLVTV